MKQKLASLGGNLGSLLLALVLALAAWASAVTSEDPDEVRTLSVAFTVGIEGLKQGLVAQGYQDIGVQVSLRAPRSVLNGLQPDQVHILADLTGKTEGEYTVPLNVNVDLSPVRVVKIEPSSITILIDHLASRAMTVQAELTGNPALGFQAGTPIIDPGTVVLSGPESLVNRVAKIVAPVNAEGLRSEANQIIPLVPMDSDGNTVNGVTLDPAEVSVTVPVQQLRGYRELVVTVPLVGTVKYGYRMTNLTTNPRVVTVYSDDTDIILAMPGYVETEPLDITGASADITRSLSLVLPEGVQVVGDPKVVVQVSISPIEDSITLSRPIRIKNLAPGLSAKLSPSVVDVILSGPANIIWSLSPSDVDVFVDLQDLGPGIHKQIIEVAFVNPALEGVVNVILSPDQVEVSIQSATTPSP